MAAKSLVDCHVHLGTLRTMIQTKNRFDRHVEVCNGLTLGFRSLDERLPHTVSTSY